MLGGWSFLVSLFFYIYIPQSGFLPCRGKEILNPRMGRVWGTRTRGRTNTRLDASLVLGVMPKFFLL
nr:unnamed protein product [Meloidogyne enterolobii]CAD2201781.1 unnamed protein product [Meloidogyne enterolobii]